MRSARTYAFDAFVNLILQAVLWLFAMFTFVWINPVFAVAWFLCTAGIGALMSRMQRWAELRRGAGFKKYLLCSILPVNAVAVIAAVSAGISLSYNYSHNPSYNYHGVEFRFFPLMIVIGTACVTLAFLVINRTARKKA